MWKLSLQQGAQGDYDRLVDSVRQEALAILFELAGNPYLEDAAPIRGHRNHYRLRFYRDQYRMIYRVSRSQRKVVVTRIRRRDESTYIGYEAG